MSMETLEQTFQWVFASGLVRQPFNILWHAGEPLVLPVSYYRLATELVHRHNVGNVPILQSFQTNATLIDAAWCNLFRQPDMHVGVSVDGPAFLHDRCRRTRQGRGTLDRVLRGIECLHEHGIPFEVITVLTSEALDYPDELFDFYREHGIASVGFNVEEIEGPHTSSSLQRAGTPDRFRRFLKRFLLLARSASPPLLVREFETSAAALLGRKSYEQGSRTQESSPFAILNVDCDGNFSTYSPELLGVCSQEYGSFALGNVACTSLDDALASARFRRVDDDIGRGNEMCRASCSYYPFCGGGPPANKYFENGTFASAETMFCRLHKKICLDVTAAMLEAESRKATADGPSSAALQAERASV
jgi:uncharacterized protein